ncbi:uncharacterized protein LOC104265765 [Ciona intestinalis]
MNNNNLNGDDFPFVNNNRRSAGPPKLIPIGYLPNPTSFGSFPRFPNPLATNERQNHRQMQLPVRASTGSRRSRHFVPNECKDEYYWRKRKKNNEAARKSREKRKTIDSVLEDKVLFLSQENLCLRNELYALKVKYGEIDGTEAGANNLLSDKDHTDDLSMYSMLPSPSNSLSEVECKSSSNMCQRESTPPPVIYPEGPNEKDELAMHNLHKISELHTKTADGNFKVDDFEPTREVICQTREPHSILSNLAAGKFVLTSIDLPEKSPTQGVDLTMKSAARDSQAIAQNSVPGSDCVTYEAASVLVDLLKMSQNPQTPEKKLEDESCSKYNSSLPHKLRFKGRNLEV